MNPIQNMSVEQAPFKGNPKMGIQYNSIKIIHFRPGFGEAKRADELLPREGGRQPFKKL